MSDMRLQGVRRGIAPAPRPVLNNPKDVCAKPRKATCRALPTLARL